MGNLVATYLKKQGAEANAAIQRTVDEPNKNIALGALGLMLDQTADPMGLVTNSLSDKIGKTWGTEAQVIKMVTPDPTLVSTRTFAVTHVGQTSSLVSVAMGYVGASFRVNPNQFDNSDGSGLNMVELSQYLDREMQAITNKMKVLLEDEAIANLQATKTKVLVNQLEYDFAGDSVVAAFAQGKTVIGDVLAMITANNYAVDGSIGIVGDAGTQTLFNRINENGGAQAVNESGRLTDKQYYGTNNIPSAVGKYANFFAVPKGSIGLLTRVAPDAIAKRTTSDWNFDSMNGAAYGLPFPMEIRSLVHGADVSAYTGNAKDTASVEELYHIGFDYAIITPHEADAVSAKTPVLHVLVNTAATDADTTAPAVDSIVSSALTELTIAFDEAMAIDADGETAISSATLAEIQARFTFTETVAGAAITDFVASDDNTELTLTLTPSGTPTGTTDTINAIADGFYDGAGNVLAAGAVARINAGGTAYEAIP